MKMTFGVVKLYANYRIQTSSSPVVYTEYEEGSLHRPVFKAPTTVSDIAPVPTNALYTYSDVTPRKGNELSVMELPIDPKIFENVLEMTAETPRCIYIEPVASSGYVVIGWIDRAEPVATKGPNMNTRIYWHVDYYLTGEYMRFEYKRRQLAVPPAPAKPIFSYGQGTVKRGPESMKRPDPSSPRKWLYDSQIVIDPGDIDVGTTYPSKGPYAIVVFTENFTIGGVTYTQISVGYWGCNTEKITYLGNDYYVPANVNGLYMGIVEEMMGIASNSIIAMYVSPIPPYELSNTLLVHGTGQLSDRAWYKRTAATNPYILYTDLLNKIGTDDEKKYIFMDPNNTIYGTTPWGIEFQRIRSAVSVGTTGAWLDVSLIENSTDTAEKPGEGRIIQVPLLAVPVTDNQRSDYALTGQQDYDRTMATLQQQQNLQSGIAGSGQSALGGLVGGAVAGGVGGAAAGAVGGLALGIAGSYLNSEIQGYYDSKGFEAMDRLLSNQTASVIVGGGGELWNHLGNKWRMVCLERDSESLSELQADQTERGYPTEVWMPDCSSLIATGGGLRIEGLEIKGNLTAEGRQYIAALFARGVHLDILT